LDEKLQARWQSRRGSLLSYRCNRKHKKTGPAAISTKTNKEFIGKNLSIKPLWTDPEYNRSSSSNCSKEPQDARIRHEQESDPKALTDEEIKE
jgi:hypothetical protein